MPTYIYEVIPESENEVPRRFEVRQSMNDAPLTADPETGRAVRRVIIGGTGLMGGAGPSMPPGGSCGTGCGCH
ncbi:MAG TPA: hypothetical protein DIT64_09065 [Verrucomicrobiales bacterium]|nr:hypothetical protein [Verrucomicrobiales bacterium]HCN77897.1 hypothetical protein [Verrucomicrobiales bacterium]